ncbi:MAG: phosphoenolpyruvate carboxykinase (ATP) [Calditrichaeota bacterium]|nr:phosphoenolpyruvate carboxykinase (ATP) [Candidatus Cloacimonadota bacterium]MCA9787298.1 phosphoenolpyruvate carboxykinase (ATP) [Candidatus Cloacimonadota bacterium]MCB1046753.1 phosphoenolpyruvate carboxykinase (ATP) [Calditrichota bacterium]MCB9473650.1 phosphoenolpyruvate carboxykinase (ATP) [Candidatus Delongbacteria bacterium]
MINYLKISSPAAAIARELKSDYGLVNHGLANLGTVYWNLPEPALYEEILFRREGRISQEGPIVVNTGTHTARAANDKFVVLEASSDPEVWWGQYNRPFSSQKFSEVLNRLQAFMQERDLFVQDGWGGADPQYRLPIRVITEYAWHSLFARNMFIPLDGADEYRRHVPDFTIISMPSFKAIPELDGTRSDTFILLSFDHRLAIIGGTGYGGEIKKSVFTVLNYLLPREGVMTMHCSANVDEAGDTALFFGLSGTGKTTLSADPRRRLIGDDEHGWSDEGVFNFENGCYAKVINLSAEAEPEIHACTHRFGTILENVVHDPVTRRLDLDDDTRTENTRASYPLSFIGNAVPEKRAGHPKNIIMLTCDASGVMPPIAKLSTEQALYHFISGYTAKVSGTELDMGLEPEITFSACFGAPFMVHKPEYYAELLRRKIERYGVQCWLVNTGWVGGAYGVGKRISIRHTRALLDAALDGRLNEVEYRRDPLFGFQVPLSCPNVPESVLVPESSWADKAAYRLKYRQLGSLFVENFRKFAADCPPDVVAAGPLLNQF